MNGRRAKFRWMAHSAAPCQNTRIFNRGSLVASEANRGNERYQDRVRSFDRMVGFDERGKPLVPEARSGRQFLRGARRFENFYVIRLGSLSGGQSTPWKV